MLVLNSYYETKKSVDPSAFSVSDPYYVNEGLQETSGGPT
jgi:hypothetical protein